MKVHRTGWRKASTFDAFCARHDGETFAPLETQAFTGTKEQIFLIAYRAVCWELYQKQRALLAHPTVSELTDRGAPLEMHQLIQRSLSVQNAGFKKGYEDALRCKTAMDLSYVNQDFSTYEALRIIMRGPLQLAATGAITPNRTLSGSNIQTLHDVTATTQWLPFGVDVELDGFSIVFMWEKSAEAPRSYVEEIASLKAVELQCMLPQFFFAHCENTYFSESWWKDLPKTDQSFVKRLAANSNPYYYPPEYDLSRRLTHWVTVFREML